MRMKSVCAWGRCRKVFEPKRAGQVYCCDKCRMAAAAHRKKSAKKPKEPKEPEIYKKVCPICGKEFETEIRTRAYCSDRCRWEAQKKRQKQWAAEDKLRRALEEANTPKESALIRVEEPVRAPHEWAEGKEDGMQKFGEKARETMPSIVPRPRCKLERDVLAARKAGAKSYGYYKAFQIIDK